MIERERKRKKERERDRARDRARDRERDRDRKTDIETDRETQRQRQRDREQMKEPVLYIMVDSLLLGVEYTSGQRIQFRGSPSGLKTLACGRISAGLKHALLYYSQVSDVKSRLSKVAHWGEFFLYHRPPPKKKSHP